MHVLGMNGFRRTNGGEESVLLFRPDKQTGQADGSLERDTIVIEDEVLAPVPAVEIIDFIENLINGF